MTPSEASAVPYVHLIRAPNPGPMTLDGTNTWVITDGHDGALVVDPGPAIQTHLESVLAACIPRLVTIVLTHRHLDHSEGAAMLAERTGCGVRAADPQFRVGPHGLDGGQLIRVGALSLEVVETPGHTSDSRSLLLSTPDGVSRVITGDMVLGRGTTVITYPDGDLAAYFDSLDLLERLVRTRNVAELLPGHGPIVRPVAVAVPLIATTDASDSTKSERLSVGDRTASDCGQVYADVDRRLWPAVRTSVRRN
jgi:glyoxylase-like metal-dependent hydrolase (beta-lactamase superfamily II)